MYAHPEGGLGGGEAAGSELLSVLVVLWHLRLSILDFRRVTNT